MLPALHHLRMAVGLSVIAGCGMWIFRWWYDQGLSGLDGSRGLIWLSFVCHRQIGRTLLLAAIFIMVSGVWLSGFGVSSPYLVDRLNYGDFIFPNTFDTITEISAIPFQTILERISGDVWLALLSLAGLGLWGLRHPVLMVVFGPCRFCTAEFSGRQQGGILFGAYVVVWLWLACDAVRDSGRSL